MILEWNSVALYDWTTNIEGKYYSKKNISVQKLLICGPSMIWAQGNYSGWYIYLEYCHKHHAHLWREQSQQVIQQSKASKGRPVPKFLRSNRIRLRNGDIKIIKWKINNRKTSHLYMIYLENKNKNKNKNRVSPTVVDRYFIRNTWIHFSQNRMHLHSRKHFTLFFFGQKETFHSKILKR